MFELVIKQHQIYVFYLQMNWKIGSWKDSEQSVSPNLPFFHPSSKPKTRFLILLIVTSKNNKTHFGRRARRPRPYETATVKGKVSI